MPAAHSHNERPWHPSLRDSHPFVPPSCQPADTTAPSLTFQRGSKILVQVLPVTGNDLLVVEEGVLASAVQVARAVIAVGPDVDCCDGMEGACD